MLDKEIDRLLAEGVATARRILTEHDDKLELVAEFLLEHETIDADQFEAIMEGRDPLTVRSQSSEPESGAGRAQDEDARPVGQTGGQAGGQTGGGPTVDPSPAG